MEINVKTNWCKTWILICINKSVVPSHLKTKKIFLKILNLLPFCRITNKIHKNIFSKNFEFWTTSWISIQWNISTWYGISQIDTFKNYFYVVHSVLTNQIERNNCYIFTIISIHVHFNKNVISCLFFFGTIVKKIQI